MKKNIILCASLILCALTLGSCKQGAKETTDNTQKTEKKEKVKAFVYTSQHRKDKATVTQPVVAFSKKIQSVNEEEFKDNEYIEEVYVHDQIKHITQKAFMGCKNLREVHFEGEVTVINDEAFRDCSALQSVDVDTWTVGLDAFNGCTSLERVKFGDKLWWIREGAFAGCTNLKSILMGITLSKLENAFEGCTAVEEFSVPNDFKNRIFGDFAQCPNVKRIYILSTEFFKMPKNCTPRPECELFVPDAFVPQFQGDEDWSKFGKIRPLSESDYYTAEGFWKK